MPQTPYMQPAQAIAREPVDIDLSKGVDERTRPELIDWTKYLRTCENLTLDDGKALVKKYGLTRHSTLDDQGQAYSPVYRVVSGEQNVMVVGKQFGLYDVNESEDELVNKGSISELSLDPYIVAAKAGGIPVAIGEDPDSAITGVTISTKYVAVSFIGRTVLVDRKSRQCVREFDSGGHCITFVDDRYLHSQVSGTISVVDTSGTIPSSLGSSASLTTTPDTVIGIVAVSGYSLCAYVAGGTVYVDKISAAGSFSASYTSASFTLASGFCTDGTDVYVSGIDGLNQYVVEKITVSTMALAGTMTDTSTSTTGYTKLLCSSAPDGYLWMVALGSETVPNIADTIVSLKVFSRQFTNANVTFISNGQNYGWVVSSHPFYSSVTERAYVSLTKPMYDHDSSSVSGGTVGDNYLVCISDIDTYFRPAARLDNYTAVSTLGNPFDHSRTYPLPMVQFTDSSYVFCTATCGYASGYARSYEVQEVRCLDVTKCHSARNLFSGACMMSYQGSRISEVGIADSPSVFVYDTLAGSGPDAGIHNYVAVFVSSAANGEWRSSRVSRPSSIISTGSAVTISVPEIKVTKPTNVSVSCYIYRTVVGGTQYYYAGEATGGGFMSFNDDVSDGDLVSRQPLFRQPGTAGSPLDRSPPLASSHLILHKDRLFYCRGSVVYYSSFFVDGEHPWFNAQLSFPIFGGSGPIVGLASMNGQLIIFKKDAIFVVDGDGPGEGGGSGNEFSPPRRVTSEFGCVDARSIVLTEKGLLYVSQRGIDLLTESLSVVAVGDLIKNTFDAYPYVCGSTYDRANSKVYFILAAALGSDLRATKASGGVVVSFDTIQGAWTVNKYSVDTRGYSLQDVCFSPLTVGSNQKDKVCFLNDTYLFYEDESTCLDNGNYNNFSIVTGDVRLQSGQDRARISDLLLLLKSVTAHDLTVSVAYNYSDTYTHSKTWTAAQLSGLTIEQLEFQVPQQQVMAARFKIEDSSPSSGSVGIGRGPDILFITPKLGAKGGGAKLASGQKG